MNPLAPVTSTSEPSSIAGIFIGFLVSYLVGVVRDVYSD